MFHLLYSSRPYSSRSYGRGVVFGLFQTIYSRKSHHNSHQSWPTDVVGDHRLYLYMRGECQQYHQCVFFTMYICICICGSEANSISMYTLLCTYVHAQIQFNNWNGWRLMTTMIAHDDDDNNDKVPMITIKLLSLLSSLSMMITNLLWLFYYYHYQ